MASLKHHGQLIGTIDTLTARTAHMSDGHLLRHNGRQWKLWKKLKPGVDPVAFYKKQLHKSEQLAVTDPAKARYQSLLQSTTPLKHRNMLDYLLREHDGEDATLLHEINSIWRMGITHDRLVQLLQLRQSAVEEHRRIQNADHTTAKSQVAHAA